MKTMKIWRLAFGLWPSHLTLGRTVQAPFFSPLIGVLTMLAALSFASCSSDDDDEFQMDQLAGTWKQVHDAGVVAEGTVQYTFTPGTPAIGGQCTIHVSDVFAGDTTFVRDYVLTEDRHLAIYIGQYGGTPPEINEYDVQRLSANTMTWHLTNSDVVLNFKKIK